MAIEFSILRATSVSSCAGAAPGSAAVTVTVGRSMSGKFCTFIALKDSMPAKVSSTNSITAGIGLRDRPGGDVHHGVLLTWRLRRGRGGRRPAAARRFDHAHQVAVVQEAGAAGHDARIGRQRRR